MHFNFQLRSPESESVLFEVGLKHFVKLTRPEHENKYYLKTEIGKWIGPVRHFCGKSRKRSPFTGPLSPANFWKILDHSSMTIVQFCTFCHLCKFRAKEVSFSATREYLPFRGSWKCGRNRKLLTILKLQSCFMLGKMIFLIPFPYRIIVWQWQPLLQWVITSLF